MWLYLWYDKPTFYKKALQCLRDENILFTKIFQSLANSSNVQCVPELKAELQHYSANTSYTESEIDYETLDQIEQAYNLQIDRRVINSGMIALVFKGYDADGTPVIIKLKRRDITNRLKKACESVVALYKFISYWYPKNIYVRVLKPFITNIDDIIEQCDFACEISNMKKAKEDYEPLDFIKIPIVYNESPTETDYIVMEFIDGTHTLPDATTEDERLEYMEKFGTFTTYAVLYNALQHTDLHSGNILFTPTGLGIIDFGMATQLSDEIHEVILSIAEIIRDQTPLHEIDVIDSFKDIFVPPLNKAEITDIVRVEDIIISIAQPLADNIDLDELNITDSIEVLAQHLGRDIVLNKDVYKIILGLSMMSGKINIMGPHFPNSRLIEIERRALQNAYALIMR
jgi:predicted unusual protein kinase regulating ubiquinone biosynthesis (AarF/ABC1/UbiB family)